MGIFPGELNGLWAQTEETDQQAVVVRVIEGIYESAAIGKVVYFEGWIQSLL